MGNFWKILLKQICFCFLPEIYPKDCYWFCIKIKSHIRTCRHTHKHVHMNMYSSLLYNFISFGYFCVHACCCSCCCLLVCQPSLYEAIALSLFIHFMILQPHDFGFYFYFYTVKFGIFNCCFYFLLSLPERHSQICTYSYFAQNIGPSTN